MTFNLAVKKYYKPFQSMVIIHAMTPYTNVHV